MRVASFLLAAPLMLCAGAALAAGPSADISALELRLKALEDSAEALRQQADAAQQALAEARAEIEQLKRGQADVEAAVVSSPPPAAGSSSANGNEFNPAISIVLDGKFAHHSLNPEDYQRAGFPLVGEGGPGERGFSIGESEFSFAANIDDKFFGQVTLAAESEDGEDSIGVEEAYVETTGLSDGLTLRAGRFFSNIGYLNTHHAHTDKFSDRPLAYQALLGNQYGDDGVQVRWVAPTDIYLELGAEALRGQNFPSGGAGHSGLGVNTLFAHLGGDIGAESSWLFGLSALESRTDGAEDGFVGKNRLYVADATWKWAPQGNFKDGGLTLRAEYLRDDRNGDYVDPEDPALDQVWDGQRSGAYVEAVFRINRRWETGYRYDRLWADEDGPFASSFDPFRHSLMLTWLNSEFSLWRLQWSQDRPNGSQQDDVLTLQYQINMGAHGAHKF